MAIQKQVWAKDIAEQLFPSDSFMVQGINDDSWVENKTVNLNQSGALPGVKRNRTTVPATITQRTDVSPNYDLHEHTTDPTLIRDIEEVEVNYNKRQSVLRLHVASLNLDCANWMQYYWGASESENIIRTSGANTDAVVAGATGTRKKLTIDDLVKAKSLMDDMDVPANGRYMLLPAYMYNNLIIDEKELLMNLEFSGRARIQDGEIMKVLGFNLFKRGKKNLLTYSNAATPVKRTPDATTGATTANSAAIFWHKDFVRRAKGAVKVFADIDEAAYYGSIFSSLARTGGRIDRSDETGVGVIVESAGA